MLFYSSHHKIETTDISKKNVIDIDSYNIGGLFSDKSRFDSRYADGFITCMTLP